MAVRKHSVFINGRRRLVERYPHALPDYTFHRRVVPRDSYFVLGDKRINSFDSSK